MNTQNCSLQRARRGPAVPQAVREEAVACSAVDAQAPLPKLFAAGERGTSPCRLMTLHDLVVESYEVFKFPQLQVPFASDERFDGGLNPVVPVARGPVESPCGTLEQDCQEDGA